MSAVKKEFSNSFSLTDEIADIVRERILKGEYEIGEKIKENQIATELRVSRTPIREAFKQLENEGLIDYVPNRGCFAKGFTRRDVDDIYQVREALEVIAVQWACERISDKEIADLEEQCDLMELYTLKKDSKKIMELNTSFHDIIYNASRSRFLAHVLRAYKEYLDKARKTIFTNQDYLENILAEHRGILDAIREKDAELAKQAMTHHLECSRERAENLWNLK